MEKKTPLYDSHIKNKGKMVVFANYLMPVQYEKGLVTEHLAVRNKAGLFDVSHMGQIVLRGPDAFLNIQRLLTNDFSNMKIGQAKYSPMCNYEGYTLDDLIVLKHSEDRYTLGVNASNRDRDYEWIKANVTGNVEVIDESDSLGQLALQGPLSKEILSELVDEIPEKRFTFIEDVDFDGMKLLISKTGYTGEEGYEITCMADDLERLFNALTALGFDKGMVLCGLGARDTLRLEASMPLYGHELSEEISPLEAGLHFAVKLSKDEFIGKEALLNREIKRIRVGLEITSRGIVREDNDVFLGDKLIGKTSSGTFSPSLNYPIAMAYIDREYADIGRELRVMVRGREVMAKICKMPFYSK